MICKLVAITGILLISLQFISVQASGITPSDVYRKTEMLRLTLQQQGLLDLKKYQDEEDDRALRHPRHVMQKVRECHTLLARLLKQKNIQVEPLPELFSVREIRPSDVQNSVDHLVKQASGLNEVVQDDVQFEEGKVPSDVYNNLKRICSAVRVEIVPSDVYQIAAAVNNNLNKIVEMRGYDFNIPYRTFSDKVPGDVYQETWRFLEDLRTLALNPDFAIPGGVIVPNHIPQREIIPQDVIALMNDALAETGAMKYTLGVRENKGLPAYQDNKTPSDVYAQITRAHTVVKTLLEQEAQE